MIGTKEAEGGAGIGELPATLALQSPAWLQELIKLFSAARKPRAQRRAHLVETLNLGGKRQLLLVVCDGRSFLVGAGSDSVNSIVEIQQGHLDGLADEAGGIKIHGPSLSARQLSSPSRSEVRD